MPDNTWAIILFSLSEIVALVVIVRLWMRRRVKLVPCLFWSVVLLVPVFGLLAYLFLHEEPEAHPYAAPNSWTGYNGADDFGDGHGGH